jgi:hypothetical protein
LQALSKLHKLARSQFQVENNYQENQSNMELILHIKLLEESVLLQRKDLDLIPNLNISSYVENELLSLDYKSNILDEFGALFS